MERQIIDFKADGQQLEMLTPFKSYAANTIRYIEARFNFYGDAWNGYSNIYAVWYTDTIQKESEIIDGVTIIPAEVLARPGVLCVNLCANLESDGILKARMTSYPVNVLKLKKANI